MYEIYGNADSDEIIIAIPALAERKEMFLPLAARMNNYKWIAFDLPGSNKEQMDDYSIPNFCKLIKSTLIKLNIKKAHFIGNSIGAWIIQAFAATYSEHVKSIALLDGGHYFLGERDAAYEYVELPTAIEKIQDIKDAIRELTYSMPNLNDDNYINFEQYFLNNYIKLGEFYAHHCDEVAYNSLSKEVSKVDYCLKETSLPMLLLIAGASADQVSFDKSFLFNKNHDQAIVTLVQDGQHYLPLTNTDTIEKSLTSFYQSL